MFRSTLFWCLSFLCVFGLESAIVWKEVPEMERLFISECIMNSKRLEIVNPTQSSVPSEQSLLLSRREKRKAKKHKQTEVVMPPKLTPLAQFTIENAPRCRLVVSSYEAKGTLAHFFSAIAFDGKSSHVTRLGSIYNTVNQNRVPVKVNEAKSQAEHYFLWTPYPCKENWEEVDQSESRAELLKVNNEDYTLKWIWTVVMDNMVGIYCGPATGLKQFSKYIYAIGQQLNTANAKLVTSSKPASLAESEANIEIVLSGVHPFLAKEWLNAEQFKSQLTKDPTALNALTDLAAVATRVDASEMLLQKAKGVTTCKGLICVFKVQPDAGQESYYVLAGGLFDDYDRYEMTMYINMGSIEFTTEKCDMLVENHFTLAFNPSIMPTSGYCQWPWKHTKSPVEHLVPYDTIKLSIADKVPFSINLEEIHVQKIKTWNYDSTLNDYKIAAYVIYGYKGRFFTAFLQSSKDYPQWGHFQVSGLMFAEHLEKEINRYHDENHENRRRGISSEILSEKVFPKILSELPNITGWKSRIPDKITEDWIIDNRKVVAPVTPRNASIPTEWFYYMFKVTENGLDPRKNKVKVSLYFTVIVVNKGEDVIIVKTGGKKAWLNETVANNEFQEFLKKQHANALLEL